MDVTTVFFLLITITYGKCQRTTETTFLTTFQVTCVDGWTPNGKYCYKVFVKKQSWFDALSSCRRLGADLISIEDVAEDNFIKDLVRSSGRTDIWLGLNDLVKENNYMWSDGSALRYTNWQDGEPNDYNRQEDCVEYRLYYNSWNDNNCYKSMAYVCKQPRGMVAPTTDVIVEKTPGIDFCETDLPWRYYREYCYYISTYPVTLSWRDALTFCKQHRSELASIHSEMENNIIFNKVSELTSDAWIGLSKIPLAQLTWTDRTAVDHVNWGGKQPDREDNLTSCASMSFHGGVWNDEECSRVLPFICKKEIGGNSVTPVQSTSAIMGSCLPNFLAFGSKCYLIQSGSYDWTRSIKSCAKYGPGFVLASINDHFNQEFLVRQMHEADEEQSFFIGLNDLDMNGKYEWLDNSPVSYTNFRSGEPSEHVMENCVEILLNGTWNNLNCASRRGFICQGPRVEASSTPLILTRMAVSSDSSVTVPPLNHTLCDTHTEHLGLTLGSSQIVGIIIGILGAFVIIGVVEYIVIKRRVRARSVQENSQNALYDSITLSR